MVCPESPHSKIFTHHGFLVDDIRRDVHIHLGKNLGSTTIKRRLRDAGLRGCPACRKPFISEQNRRKRVAWAKAHLSWSEDDWSNVLFTDESPFVLQWKGRVLVWRRVGERYHPDCLQGTVKHDKKIMIWGCFSSKGVGAFIRIRGILVKEKYRQILIHHAVPSGNRLLGKGFTFQQDNDPKHTAIIVRKYFKNKEKQGDLKLMDWPSQSPDLNPIENLWRILNDSTKDRKPSSENELFDVLQEGWKKIGTCVTKKLVLSMKRRCEAVIANRGYPTKY